MSIRTEFSTGEQAQSRLGGEPYLVENYLDFSATNVSSADVVEALKIPANCLVENVRINVLTAEGGAGNIDVGDGSDVDGFDVDVDINAVALTLGNGAYITTAGGKIYTAADTIDVIPSIDLDTAIVHISALVTPVERLAA